MESTHPGGARTVVQAAALVLANLTALMIASVTLAVRRDLDVTLNSATPVTDGAGGTLLVVMALVLVNGVVLGIAPGTRRVGLGLLLALVLSLPVGLVVHVFALTTFTR